MSLLLFAVAASSSVGAQSSAEPWVCGPDDGHAEAERLTAAPATAPTGHAIIALAALARGRLDAALAAAVAAEAALTPDHTTEDAAFVASVRANVDAARGTSSGAEPDVRAARADVPAGHLAALSSIRPNPTGGSASLDVTLTAAARLDAEVFDGLGRRVAVLASGEASEGTQTLTLDTSAWAPGVYCVRVLVRASGQSSLLTRRVVVAR